MGGRLFYVYFPVIWPSLVGGFLILLLVLLFYINISLWRFQSKKKKVVFKKWVKNLGGTS